VCQNKKPSENDFLSLVDGSLVALPSLVAMSLGAEAAAVSAREIGAFRGNEYRAASIFGAVGQNTFSS